MATLFIFGDESGTMPINDNDIPFVAATVSFVDVSPTAVKGSNNDDILISIFKEQAAIPFAAYVKPFPGYGEKLRHKHNKGLTMARATRLITGANEQYLDPDGINLGNFIWSHAMNQAIGHAIRKTMLSTTIDSLQILLDQKTMTAPMRRLFTQTVTQKGHSTRKLLFKNLKLYPEKISLFLSRIQFSEDSTIIKWSDEVEEHNSEFGLKIADRFSRKIYQHFSNNESESLVKKMKASGFEDFVYDITDIVTRFDKRLIDRFKQNTGLPDPRLL